jgi:hypothetical protein
VRTSLNARLDWLTNVGDAREARDGAPDPGHGYLPQAYDQLEAVLRRAGRESDARCVAIEKQRRRRRKLNHPTKAFNWLADKLVGYGYRTWKAAVGLVLLWALSAVIFAIARASHDMQAIEPSNELPHFHPWPYAVDTVAPIAPIVSFGQESARTPKSLALAWWAFALLMGWLLTTAVVAALTARLVRV